jgi:phosphonate transport system ATP-binding protein
MRFANGVTALHAVDLRVERDDFVVVLGPSGAGKSTLLRSLNRLNTPTAGQVLFHGRDVTHASGSRLRTLRQRVGMIFQQFNLVERRTVMQNVLAGRLRFTSFPLGRLASLVGWFGRDDQERAFECLRRVGIERTAMQRADTLSGGQRQRVAIARLLAQEPEVILADEPIASLDPRSSEQVMDTLRSIHESRGIPVVVNLHQVDVARRYGKRIVGMRGGRVVFDGPPGTLGAPAVRALYGRDDPPRPLDDGEQLPALAGEILSCDH